MPFSAIPLLLVVGLLLPALAWLGYRQLAATAETPTVVSGRALAVQTLVLQAVLIGLSLLAIEGAGLTVHLGARVSAIALLATAAVVAGGLLATWLEARRRVLGPRDAVRRTLRGIGAGDPWWLAANLAAAVGEELAYRGALTELLSPWLGAAAAVALSAALFGLAHLTQGWRGAVFSAAQALAFQGLVILSGGLALAIVAHLAYDLGAHLLGRRLARASDSG